jgi:hypothetical protein
VVAFVNRRNEGKEGRRSEFLSYQGFQAVARSMSCHINGQVLTQPGLFDDTYSFINHIENLAY